MSEDANRLIYLNGQPVPVTEEVYLEWYGLSSVTVAPIPEAYQDVTSVTATAADVLANKIIIDSTGQTVAGTIPVNGAIASTFNPLSQTSVAIPAGYTTGGAVTLTEDLELALAAI